MKGRHGQEAAHANRAAVVSKTIQSGARGAVACASVLLALPLPLSAADAQGGNESSVHEPGYSYESLLKRIHDYDLTGAGHVIDSLIDRLPAHPKPYFFLTLARWWRLAGETSSDSLQTSFLDAAAGRGSDRALGIAQLRFVAARGIYSRVEVLSLLGYINLQMENDYPEAVRIFSALPST